MPAAAGDLSYAQLETLWDQAGGQPDLAPTMAAIGLAESGGNPNALNPNDNGGKQSSFGIWQISNGTHAAPSPTWNNPATNASLAVAKYKSQGLGAWGTYTSGLYKKFMNGAAVPSDASQSGGSAGSAGSSGCAVSTPSIPLLGSACLLSNSELKALKGGLLVAAGGTIFVVGGLILVAYGFQRTGVGKEAARTASSALKLTPQGRGLSAARTVTSASEGRTGANQSRRRAAGADRSRVRSDVATGRVRFPSPNDDAESYERSRGSRRANQRAARQAGLSAPSHARRRRARDTSDLRRRTA